MGWIGSAFLAGSSQRAPRILIFSIAMGADYSFYVKIIETHARAFFTHNILVIGSVLTYFFFSFFIFSIPFFQVAYQSSRGRGIWLNFWNRGSTGHRNWGCWGHGGHKGCRPPKPCRGCWRKRVSFSIPDFLIPSFNPGLFNQLHRNNSMTQLL